MYQRLKKLISSISHTWRTDRGLALAWILVGVAVFAALFPWDLLEKISSSWFRINLKVYEGFGQFLSGVTTPFLTLAAFILLYKTYKSQKEELFAQKQELRETREEFEKQNETLRLQRFENTFFSMLDLHNDIVDKMRTASGRVGRSVIDFAKEQLAVLLAEHGSAVGTDVDKAKGFINTYYISYYRNFESSLNHYFRQLYHVFKFIYFSELDPQKQDFYVSIARSTLSQNELYLIAFNGIIEGYGNPRMLFLIKAQDILKNFEKSDIKPLVFWALIHKMQNEAEYGFDKSDPHGRHVRPEAKTPPTTDP
jgi:hypothetical protein